ncbi:hypothetical protein ACIRQP_14930 [Streptomyces sp. NPDC102274]|uniref:hypothetical protein n=1 Tax=Streptomyces sp. NPDC102274 TaxID=3366151 RepID=UPI003801CE08
MTRLQTLARRLWDGSTIRARRLADTVTTWIRKGRREDLTGFVAVLGCWLRVALVALGLYVLWRLVRAMPALLWLIVPVWCWKAVRAAPAGEAPADGPDLPEDDAEDHLRDMLSDLIGDRPGVHLSTVLDHLQKQGQGEGWEVADLRSRLEALGVPVRRSVKVARRVAYGVHRDDLAAPSPQPVEEAAA